MTYTPHPGCYNLGRYTLGVAEGPDEIRGKRPISYDMADNHGLNFTKLQKQFPKLLKKLKKGKRHSFILSFNVLSKPEQKITSLETDINDIHKDVDYDFKNNLIGMELKVDDEITIGKVIGQQWNYGIAEVSIKKLGVKKYTLISIGSYEARVWRAQYDEKLADQQDEEFDRLDKKDYRIFEEATKNQKK